MGKRNRKGEVVVKEGYVGKPKGMKQIAFERGLYKPPSADGKHKMNGKKFDEEDANQDPSYSLPYVLSHCWDFAHAPTALQELVESRGHILRMSVKAHPELAGVGIEYSWGKSKQMFRRVENDRVASHLRRNIIMLAPGR